MACRLQGRLIARSCLSKSAGRKTFQKNNWSQDGDKLISASRADEVGVLTSLTHGTWHRQHKVEQSRQRPL